MKFTPQYYKRVRSSDVYFLDISEGDKNSQRKLQDPAITNFLKQNRREQKK